jgi:hypothetical protein
MSDMTLDAAIARAVADAIRAELPRVLDDHFGRDRLLAIDDTGVSRRLLLRAASAGEITIYRRGQSAWVRAEDLDRWILDAPDSRRETPADPVDEIGELIEMGERRQRVAK